MGGWGCILDSLWSSDRLEATWFLEHNSSLLWNFNFNFQRHVVFGHALKPVDFEQCHFQNGHLPAISDFLNGILRRQEYSQNGAVLDCLIDTGWTAILFCKCSQC